MKKDTKRSIIAVSFAAISLFLCYLFTQDKSILYFAFYVLFACASFITLPEKWNGSFLLSIFVCSLFIISPVLLIYDEFAILVSAFLAELKTTEYKSVYIEAIAAFLGSFLAITGALWTENRIRVEQNKEDDARNSRVVYYDLKFAFTQIKNILKESNLNSSNNRIEKPQNFDKYRKFAENLQGYLVLIDDNWIRTVSYLPEGKFTEAQREHIYLLYDYLCKIQSFMEKCPENIPGDIDNHNSASKAPWERVYFCMYELLLISPREFLGDFAAVNLTVEEDRKRKNSQEVWEVLLAQAKIP